MLSPNFPIVPHPSGQVLLNVGVMGEEGRRVQHGSAVFSSGGHAVEEQAGHGQGLGHTWHDQVGVELRCFCFGYPSL